MTELLSLAGVHTHVGRYHILQGVDFSVAEGQTTTLLGRNGAGKTSTLRTIMGLWHASAGHISQVPTSAGCISKVPTSVGRISHAPTSARRSATPKPGSRRLSSGPPTGRHLSHLEPSPASGQVSLAAIGGRLVADPRAVAVDL